MNKRRQGIRGWLKLACLLATPGFMLAQFSGTCSKLANLTQWVDPCGTVFADCFPGQFQLYASDVPNYDLDPTCTIPGGCLPNGPPSAQNPFVSPYAHLHPGASGP
jgi:hypothetical protein